LTLKASQKCTTAAFIQERRLDKNMNCKVIELEQWKYSNYVGVTESYFLHSIWKWWTRSGTITWC